MALKGSVEGGSRPSAQRSVIVVDDDQAVCHSLRFALEIEGYRVQLYYNADAVLAARGAAASEACLVVDYHLPGMNGLDLVQQLRRRTPGMNAILITTGPSERVRTAAEDAGVVIVEKPLLGNALAEAIRHSFCAS
ncbi:response regulator [Pseudoxanthobacter sp.]|uniref:response regulator n=1 Tax=Pseudoxanthobacter sp. TaxID=1925742 RepID=UPI002FE24187